MESLENGCPGDAGRFFFLLCHCWEAEKENRQSNADIEKRCAVEIFSFHADTSFPTASYGGIAVPGVGFDASLFYIGLDVNLKSIFPCHGINPTSLVKGDIPGK
jgi:hypothetical protein